MYLKRTLIFVIMLFTILSKNAFTRNYKIFSRFDFFLKKHVTFNNSVNYANLKKDKSFYKFINSFKNIRINKYRGMYRKALFINLYNFVCLYLVARKYPNITQTIRVPNFFSQAFVKIGIKKYSLNEIEKNILIREFKDPLIHFVINCAALSCPPIINRAYFPKKLNTLLKVQTIKFMKNPVHGIRVNDYKKVIYISSLFKWYKKDFKNIKKFIEKFRLDLKQKLKKYKIKYLFYNWNLNRTS